MKIAINSNKIYSKPQCIKLSHPITTLIGENGCGKSAILERIFFEYLTEDNVSVICFSSGQNESFSKIFTIYKKHTKRFEIENSLTEESKVKSFHFDFVWLRFLIFFATIKCSSGLVREYLRNNDYAKESEDIHLDDATTKLYFDIRIPSRYITEIKHAIKREEKEFGYRSIRKSFFHRILQRLVEHAIYKRYDFEAPIRKRGIMLDSERVLRVFDMKANDIFAFLNYASHSNQFIDIWSSTLRFEGLELNDLSDGEAQLLGIYALIDLFDSDEALFLFDEVDSHLYYENVQRLWEAMSKINGNVIATTHSADSIISNNFESIRIVQNGRVNDSARLEEINRRLDCLTEAENYKFRFASKAKHLVLIDDVSDWYIFTLLAKQIEVDTSKLEGMQVVGCHSGQNTLRQGFGHEKKEWVRKFIEYNGKTVDTKEIFMICDRDELPIKDIGKNGVKVEGAKQIQFGRKKGRAHLLSWRRREIENYLCCHRVLEKYGVLDKINEKLPAQNPVIAGGSGDDNESIQSIDIKDIIKGLYLHRDVEKGVCKDSLSNLISRIPRNEISEDIQNMYNFIVGKINATES